MRFLIQHGEKVVCTAIVALCGVWVYGVLTRPDPRVLPEGLTLEQLRPRDDTARGEVPPSYPYQPAYVTPYADQMAERMERAGQPPELVCSGRLFYPQPERPHVIQKVKPSLPEIPAEFPAFGELKAEARHGKVVLTCTTPVKTRHFLPVRVELLRGKTADRIDRLIHVFEFGATVAPATKVPEAAEGARSTESPAVNNRMRRGSAHDGDKAKASVKLQFEDTDVKAGEICYYRARLLTQRSGFVTDALTIIENGEEMQLVIPARFACISGPADGVKLFASPWLPVVQATVPVDIQLRYQFVTNRDLPAAASDSQKGYSAFFGIRLWDAEAQAWSESSFAVAPGQPVNGALKFKTGTTTRVREFDTRLVLQAVRRATRFQVEEKNEPVTVEQTNEDGEILKVQVIGKDGKLKYSVRHTVTPKPTEVAVLKDSNTGREVRLVQGLGYEDTIPADVKLVLEGETETLLDASQAAAVCK